jgi:hypothetical protein
MNGEDLLPHPPLMTKAVFKIKALRAFRPRAIFDPTRLAAIGDCEGVFA